MTDLITQNPTPPKTAPARILLQIGEGVENELFAFEMPVKSTQRLAQPNDSGAHFDHSVDVLDIIAALAQAQKPLVDQLKAEALSPAHRAEVDGFFAELWAWVLA